MKYLKFFEKWERWEENPSEEDISFEEDIENYFLNIVDEYNLIEMDDDRYDVKSNSDANGICYKIIKPGITGNVMMPENTIQISIHLTKRFYDKLENMRGDLENFIFTIEELGYKVILTHTLDKYLYFWKKHTSRNTEDDSFAHPFEIEILRVTPENKDWNNIPKAKL